MSSCFRHLCLLMVFSIGCALPQESSDFAVMPSSEDGEVFLSSKELMVSGLVSESIGVAGRGRLFDAEARLRRALMLSPGEPTIMFNLAVVLSQQGYAEEATELLKELRAKQGDHPRYAIAMADVHLGQRRLAQAREELKLAYEAFSQAANWPQAATVARSISNLAFAEGAEQEALCYSYEAFVLDQSATQLGYHASMLVALNLLTTADTFVGEQLALSPSLGALPRVHLARALARGGLKNMTGAVDEIEQAQNLLAQDPEIGAEVNVVWWLFRKQIPETEEDRQDTKLQESLEAIEPEVVRLRDKPTYNMVRWPVAVLGMLYQS